MTSLRSAHALPIASVALLSCGLASCATDTAAPARLALIDPLGILDSVTSDLQLLVLPADRYGCGADGRAEPNLADTPGAVFEDAVVDITFTVAEGTSVDLDPGTYTVLARGRGTDPVSGVGPNELIATGCATGVEIAAGETREVSLEMKQIIHPGVCGDGVLSPDEQCDGSTPSPCAMCRTTEYGVSTTPLSTDSRAAPPALGFADGGMLVASYDAPNTSGTGKVRFMVLDEAGQPYPSGAVALDEQVDVGAPLSGVLTSSSAASSPARVAVAFAGHFVASDPGGDAFVRFFDATDTSRRTPLGPATPPSDSTGAQGQPSLAMLADGTALVAFSNDQSASGASVRVFAAGSLTPSGAGAAVLGTGLTGVEAPSAAASDSGFVVAFAAAGDIYFQRFGADGSPTDAAPVAATEGVDSTGTQSHAQAAALGDGRFAVAFLDEGSGKVRARAFDASGVASGPALDLSGPGASAPDLAGGHERYVAVWVEGGSVMARLLDGSGAFALNREPTPSGDAFVVSTGATAPNVAIGGPTGSTAIAAVSFVKSGALMARLYPVP